ncbi:MULTISPECIES: hypothetical protein [unclassified Azospirillum]|uniref:hypothetical protein n=1 Tax=unclassified Azospirillum TaxID=2630922 RepID=UPI000D64F23C|nr:MULTISPECIES: hypothetical protein [unclassified Azospirillum]
MLPAERAFSLIGALPASIRVGPFDFEILKMDPMRASAERKFGFFSAVEQQIAIQADMATPFKAADTLIHEINHAIFWAYGIEDADAEERTVSALATAWVQVYRDNPWLLEWIGAAVKS